jgi:MYXO-CTERM domain-containing protein
MAGKYLRLSVLASALLLTTAGPILAQTPPARQGQAQNEQSDDRGLSGLVGLLGLAGLAGLMRRPERDRVPSDTTTSRRV